MGGNVRRHARRVLLALAAACAVFALVAPAVGAADDDELPPPEVFSGAASALGVSADIHPPDLLPIGDLFKFTALDGGSVYQSSNKTATASILFPGQGALQGPSLLCGTFLAPQVPAEFKPIVDACLKYKYPLTVTADEFEPDASTTGSLNLGDAKADIGGEAVLARAHAAEDGSRSDAVINNLSVLGLPPFGSLPSLPLKNVQLDGSVLKIESASARTDQRIVKGGLVAKGTTTLSGVKLLGGLINIDSIVGQSIITDDAAGEQTADALTKVSGVTVAGVPAQITSKGLVLGPSKNTTPLNLALMDQVNRLLNTLNIKITTLPNVETANKGGPAIANSGGVLIEFARDVQGLPQLPSPIGAGQQLDVNGRYSVTIQLASTGARGAATNFESDDETVVGGEDDEFVSDDFGDGSDFSLGGDDFGAGTDGPSIVNDGPGRGSNNGDGSLIASVANNFGGRIGLVYLALMFSVLGLCIAPRLAIPARFPGPKA